MKTKDSAPPPRRQSPFGTVVILLVIAGLGAVAAYRYMDARGPAAVSASDNEQIAQLTKQLKTLESRLDKLENQRRAEAKHDVELREAQQKQAQQLAAIQSSKPSHSPAPEVRRVIVMQGPKGVSAADLNNLSTKTNKELNAMQGNLTASRQEWQATVNRVGDVVGTIGSQQAAIEKTSSTVDQLVADSARSNIHFTLSRGSGLQRVGPFALKLGSTDTGGQRYSLRMRIGDKTISLKNRALNEVVQFTSSRSSAPLQLVVSQIDRSSISGTLSIPKALADQLNNAQLQVR